MIKIRGFLETSFLDWDGKVTCVVFIPNCNFNCPFCSNWLLVHDPQSLPEVPLERIEAFIKERADFLDGVVLTGGEPTVHPDLPALIKRFKALGVMVKLDTNGTNPQMLAALINEGLLDYVAMDVKAPLDEKYEAAAGAKADLNKIRESIKLLVGSGGDYEFRTTVIPNILGKAEIEQIARTIAGAKKYALQQFVPAHSLVKEMQRLDPHPAETLQEMALIARQYVPNTIVRGI